MNENIEAKDLDNKQLAQKLIDIYNALNTITVKGAADARTYTNCMEGLTIIANTLYVKPETEQKDDTNNGDS